MNDAAPNAALASAPTILVSAFEPFGGARVNASEEVARRSDGVRVPLGDAGETAAIETRLLPVTKGDAEQIVFARLQNNPRPLAYIALGEAGPERVVRLEKVYINWDDFRIPDNGNHQPRDALIIPGAPAAYFTTMDFARMEAALRGETPVPTALSLSAGAFLCNHVAFCVAHFFAENPDLAVPFGFIHVPSWRPADGEGELLDIVETVRRVMKVSLPD